MTLAEFIEVAKEGGDDETIALAASSVDEDDTLREAAEDFLMARDDFFDAVDDVMR